ncbi:peptidylprolyl isomerase family protein CPR8 SKDI_14G3480 [Saccharomyces kudriavzevii IFO 1802]|uniref:PPIase cyclophilin-type domain-containing protein n=1 Tax=Saccharomyces kudriavzevii (strain ATCC MYA-4449 / AS 2.2408 / CBS 8840 / NBRC 1802 / NCYC 2889) TaxID=226230 RepID=A0AA35J7S5_SACK1|nr:uncharacterized protein SKDI_14G3480 [Saccharomyces kudriavzevii IFO 1802]CAI4050453.1 hypothetical protein SKDI_14G3480 [Saccharomyces kudriavzevii IFO 1802]
MKSISLYICAALMFACTLALPVDNRRVSSDSLDLEKKYAPNPPATHSIILVVMFTDPENSEVTTQKMTIDLYGTMVPRTVMDFSQYAGSMKGRIRSRQRGSQERDFDKILPNGAIRGGPISPTSAEEAGNLASLFEENHSLTHDRPGRVSMIKGDAGSKFIIGTSDTSYEGDSVVFGQVISGLKVLMDKLANVETDEDGRPDHPITIAYISSNKNNDMDPKKAHEQYLQRLSDYQNGDLEKGVTLKNYLYRSNERKLEDIRYNQLHHPLPRIVLGISILMVLYVLAKYRKKIFSKSSSKIVSIRED